ncbi:DUF3536 domain-containing protein, partial [bacterium]|nr:DUF3536 domain-containing protein [bacterium]
RENPWLDTIEVQDQAKPHHDWNEKILAECYAPNTAARIVDNQNRILKISNNYRYISFNFGPTLLYWMQYHEPAIYKAILEADRYSMKRHNGHGNAIAQVYNHIIMPLASRRDKWIQIQWGIKDFQSRFGRFPEGMWLPETAVDLETLELMAEAGIRFTILAPHQALRIKKIDMHEWMDVRGGKIDPTLPYRCFLSNGRYLDIFFFDGPISNAIAFENILKSGDLFIKRLLSGFSNERVWDQILSVATDGESYGHHHKFGEMALAYLLSHLKEHHVELINYGEYLELYPPRFQVEILENTSWSCAHGVERWRGDCGCDSGSYPEWNQAWRGPLRQALDHLKTLIDSIFESQAKQYLKDPWDAIEDYVEIIIDRSPGKTNAFFSEHQVEELKPCKRVNVLKLMEMERSAQLMFTSCGWFFDDISGIETVQLLKYAARAIQLAGAFTGEDIERPFMETLSQARSNILKKETGEKIYQREVLPLKVDLKKVLRHFAISSLFESYAPNQKIYCFQVALKDFKRGFKNGAGLAMGRTRIIDQTTLDIMNADFAVLHTGGQNFTTYIKEPPFDKQFGKLIRFHFWKFNRRKLDMLKNNLDQNFQSYALSLKDLFLDERRKIGQSMNRHILKDFERSYRRIYEEYKTVMEHLQSMDIPAPQGFRLAAEYSLTGDLKNEIERLLKKKGKGGRESILAILDQGKKWQISLGRHMINEAIKNQLEVAVNRLRSDPLQKHLLNVINTLFDVIDRLKLDIEMWHIQNLFYDLFHYKFSKYPQDQIKDIIQDFKALGTRLNLFID